MLPLFLVAIFYFIVIRPEQKKAKQHKEMIEGLAKGDKIVTNGGLHAEVVKIEEDFIKVKLNDEVIVKLEKNAVHHKAEPEVLAV